MGAKVDAAISAIGGGVQAVIIAAGGDRDIIDDIMTGKVICVTGSSSIRIMCIALTKKGEVILNYISFFSSSRPQGRHPIPWE